MNIKQIAKAAGVSVATVSRVLNHPENVAPKTREKIQKIMEEEEYTPNWFAQGLNFNITKTIGLVLPHTLNTYYMEIANGVEEVARQKDYITFICNTEKDPQMEKEYIEQLVTRKVDGIILVYSLGTTERYVKWLEDQKIPTVCIGETKVKTNWDSVKVDCGAASSDMVRHLLDGGYKKIAMMCGEDPEPENQDMLRRYKETLSSAGIKLDENLICDVANNIEGGYIGMKKLINKMENLPDAVFATSDYIAYGAVDAIKEAGLRIPDDIAIVGFGNDRMTTLMDPKVTTVELPYRKMGIYGARILFDLIEEKGKDHESRSIELQAKLRIRKSSGNSGRIEEMF